MILIRTAEADQCSNHLTQHLLCWDEDAFWWVEVFFPLHGCDHLLGKRFRIHSRVKIESAYFRDSIIHGILLVEGVTHAHLLERLDHEFSLEVGLAPVPGKHKFLCCEFLTGRVDNSPYLVLFDLLLERSHDLEKEFLLFVEERHQIVEFGIWQHLSVLEEGQ